MNERSHQISKPRTAREKHRLCPGCGAKDTDVGTLCSECSVLLARARATPDKEVNWYAIDDGRLFGPYLSTHQGDHPELREMALLLIKAVAGARRWSPDLESGALGPIPDTRGASVHSGMMCVEMDEDQAAALYDFCAKLHRAGDAQRRAGFAEGDNLLHQLASGQAKPDDYEQWRSRELPKPEPQEE